MKFSFNKYVQLQHEQASLHRFNTEDKSFETNTIPSSQNTKFWIYPDGKVVQLSGWHYEHILNNLSKLKKFGITPDELSNHSTEQEIRLYALSKGFTRMNYSVNGGRLIIEAPSNNWGRTLKSAISDFVFDNAQRIDQMILSVLDSNGKQVKTKSWNWINSTTAQKMDEIQYVTEQLVMVNADDAPVINESALSRIYQHNVKHDCGAISAFRKTFNRAENDKRNRLLMGELLSKGFSVTKLVGKYPEGGTTVSENSFFVADIKDTATLFNTLIELGEKFNQDSILFIPAGTVEGTAKAFLCGTNHEESNWLGYHKQQPFDVGRMGHENPIYTSYVRGRPFMFESVDSECIPPQSGFGVWAMNHELKHSEI